MFLFVHVPALLFPWPSKLLHVALLVVVFNNGVQSVIAQDSEIRIKAVYSEFGRTTPLGGAQVSCYGEMSILFGLGGRELTQVTDVVNTNRNGTAVLSVDEADRVDDIFCIIEGTNLFTTYTEMESLGRRTTDMGTCLLYRSPSPRDQRGSRMPSSA